MLSNSKDFGLCCSEPAETVQRISLRVRVQTFLRLLRKRRKLTFVEKATGPTLCDRKESMETAPEKEGTLLMSTRYSGGIFLCLLIQRRVGPQL